MAGQVSDCTETGHRRRLSDTRTEPRSCNSRQFHCGGIRVYVTGSSRIGLAVAIAALIFCCFGTASAQSPESGLHQDAAERGYGTANLPSATIWSVDEKCTWGEIRFFDGGNPTFAAGLRMGTGEGAEAQVTLFTMDTSVEDGAGAEIRSTGTLLGLNYKWLAHVRDEMTVSVMTGLDHPIAALERQNRATGQSASSSRLIPVLSVPIEWQGERGTTWRVVPRYVGFDSAPKRWLADGTQDGTVDGFGQSTAIGLGVLHQEPQYSLMADAQILLIGENSWDLNANEPTRRMAWSAGGTWHAPESTVRVDLFATNALGPTGASSLMVSSDNSTGVGLRVTGEF